MLRFFVAGLARDCSEGLRHRCSSLLENLTQFGEVFVLVAENNSSDRTLDVLFEASETHKDFFVFTLADLDRAFPSREKRLAYLRNFLLEKIITMASQNEGSIPTFDFYVPVDLDLEINWNRLARNLKKVLQSVEDEKLSGVFPASVPRYYDIHALRAKKWNRVSPWQAINHWPRRLKPIGIEMMIARKQRTFDELREKGDYLEVQSAFGGLGFYALSRIGAARYSSRRSSCEHVGFNRGLTKLAISTDIVVDAPAEHLW